MVKDPGDARRWDPKDLILDHHRGYFRNFPIFLVALIGGLAGSAWGAKWEVVPALSVTETYTDNLSLSPDSSRQAAWVTEIGPEILVSAEGPKLEFSARYFPQLIYDTAGQNDDHLFHRLDANGHAELAENLLFLDAGAKVEQVNVSLQEPIAGNNVNTTGNRATSRTVFFSPYISREVGADFRGEARFNYGVLKSDDPDGLPESTSKRFDLQLASGPRFKLLTWNVDYENENIDYDRRSSSSIETLLGNARRLLSTNVGLLLDAGYERYEEAANISNYEGAIWAIGFEWTPTSRTRAAVTTGRRFYGPSKSLAVQHRTRLTTWNIDYSEDVTTTRSELFLPGTADTAGYVDGLYASSYPDPVARKKAVEEFMVKTGLPPSLNAPVNFYSNQFFLSKKWQASLGILGVRNVLVANVFRENRMSDPSNTNFPGSGDFSASDSVLQTGAGLLWNWRVTAQDAWSTNLDYDVSEFPDLDRTDKRASVRMALNHQFQPKLSGSMGYRWQDNDSNQNEFSYTETAVFATLSLKF